jgi:hypothetical protein
MDVAVTMVLVSIYIYKYYVPSMLGYQGYHWITIWENKFITRILRQGYINLVNFIISR